MRKIIALGLIAVALAACTVHRAAPVPAAAGAPSEVPQKAAK